MRRCPFTGCPDRIDPDKFCCRAHWQGLERRHRRRAFRLYCRWRAGEISAGEFAELAARLAARIEFEDAMSLPF